MVFRKPKIIFEKMAVQNFGPFYEYHEFDFSQDENKNVTLISGSIGAGKTTLFQLFWWVLFPEESISMQKNEIDYLRSKETINVINGIAIKKARIGDKIKILGSILFEWRTASGNTNKYLITRERIYEKIKEIEMEKIMEDFDNNNILSYVNNSDKVVIKKDGTPFTFDEYMYMINQIFPKAIRKFSLIHGEGMTRILSIENVSELKKSVLDLSEFPKIQAMGEYLDASKKFFDTKRKICNKDNETLQKKNTEIENAEKVLKKKNEKLEQYEEFLVKHHDRISEIKVDLGKLRLDYDDMNEYKQILETLENLKNKKYGESKKKKRRVKGLLDKRSDLLKTYAPYLYLEQAINLCLQDIKAKRELGIIPGPNIPKLYLEIILNRENDCVCGTEWDDNDKKEMKDNIRKMMRTSIQNLLITSITKFEGWLGAQKKTILDGKRALLKIQKELLDLNDEINKKELEKRRFVRSFSDEQIKKEYIESIQKKYEEKEDLTREMAKIETKKETLEDEIEKQRELITQLETDYDKLETERVIKKEGKDAFYYKDIYDGLIEIENINKRLAKEIGNRIREETRIATRNILIQLVNDPDIWQDVNISEIKNGWLINARFGDIYVKNISTGMTNILGLSFIFALSNILNVHLPLIFDSPFGNLDAATRELVCKNLPLIYKGRQIIFFDKMVNLTGNKDNKGNIKDLYPILNNYIEYEYKIENPDKFNAKMIKVR